MTKTENITKERRDFHLFREISPKINWESNSMVKSNSRIDKNKIFEKCSTSEFPADSISVRINSMKNKRFTVYFYSESQTRSWNNGQSHYSYIKQSLKVYCDHSMIQHPDIGKPMYSFTGQMPWGMTPDEVAFALNHIGDILYGKQ
jgi:hypothetical protein